MKPDAHPMPGLRYCQDCRLTFFHGSPLPICCPRCERFSPLLVPGPMFRLRPPAPLPWTVHPVAKLADFWIGAFLDSEKRRLYLLPLPCLGVWIQLPPASTDPGKTWARIGAALLYAAVLSWLPMIAAAFLGRPGLAALWWLPSLLLNPASIYASRRARLARVKKSVPRHWTETADLDSADHAADNPPSWPVRWILAALDLALRGLTPAGHCQACARRKALAEARRKR